jgi:taurine dioxygenase
MFKTCHLDGHSIEVFADINSLDNSQLIELVKLATQHTTVVLRKQSVSDEKLITIAKLMGRTISQRYFFCHPKYTEIGLVTNKRDEHNNKIGVFADHELGWHSNGNTRKSPQEDMILLYCKKKGLGANTYFANTRVAYNDLTDEYKNIVNNVMCELTFDVTREDPFYKIDKSDPEYALFSGKILEKQGINNDYGFFTKPLVCSHPRTKQRALYFPYQLFNRWWHLNDIPLDQSLKDFLIAHTFNPKYVYEHKWENGDIVLNDQWNTLHKRNKVSAQGERLLYRVPFGLDKINWTNFL